MLTQYIEFLQMWNARGAGTWHFQNRARNFWIPWGERAAFCRHAAESFFVSFNLAGRHLFCSRAFRNGPDKQITLPIERTPFFAAHEMPQSSANLTVALLREKGSSRS